MAVDSVAKADARYFRDNVAFAGLGAASARRGVMMLAARITSLVVQFGATVLLARLLDPRDFGLVAVVAALALFAPILVDLGTSDAASQKASISRDEIASLFWLNVAVGSAMTVAFAAGSGLLARVFGQPELLLIALVWSSTFLLTSLSVQHIALMRRAMEFRKIATIDIAANATSSVVSIGLALAGFEYWALVARALLFAAVTAAGAWIACSWRPGRPRFVKEAKGLARFGLSITGFTVLDTTSRSSDRVALGYFVGPAALGYFHNAHVLYANAVSPFVEPLHALAVSSLSKIRNDPCELKRAWAKALSMLSFWTAPAFAGLAVVATELVVIMLGEKWRPAGFLLSIMALRGIPNVIERTLGWLPVALGSPGRWARWGVIAAAWQLVALGSGLPFGATGVATAYTVSMFLMFVPAITYSGQGIGLTMRDVLAVVGPQTLGALAAVAAGFLFKLHVADGLSDVARLLLSCLVVGTVYLLVVVGLFRVREPIVIMLALVRGAVSRAAKAPG
ncbi:MAG: lipopolysaccharide biosynthesis protein [Hyphomicrobiaceae bacterium]|nr:lipopolysaccharide biosynthesis protein [Hyphomicrobiaceae bacterium]